MEGSQVGWGLGKEAGLHTRNLPSLLPRRALYFPDETRQLHTLASSTLDPLLSLTLMTWIYWPGPLWTSPREAEGLQVSALSTLDWFWLHNLPGGNLSISSYEKQGWYLPHCLFFVCVRIKWNNVLVLWTWHKLNKTIIINNVFTTTNINIINKEATKDLLSMR